MKHLKDLIINKQKMQYHKDNIELVKKHKRNYYIKHKEEILRKKKEKYKDNISPITKKKRNYNKEYHKNRYKNDIQYNIRTRLCNRFNNAIINYNKNNKYTISRNKNIDYKAIIRYLEPLPSDFYKYTIDHIIPLDFFDLTDEGQLAKAWNPINLQLLLKNINESKGNIIDFNKYPEQKVVFAKLGL